MLYDRELTISVGASRKATRWKQTRTSWSALVKKLGAPVRGEESHAAYMRMSKTRQDELKDVGGFVGGALDKGRRKAACVLGRDLVTLDLDAIEKGGTGDVLAAVSVLGCASCVYSTRKHEPDRPRLRVVIPLDRTANAEEYEPIARRLGDWLGMTRCDPTTFQAVRMMYWPSASCDSEFVYDSNEGPFLAVDEVLGTYRNWRDIAQWPGLEPERAPRAGAKQEDPEQKPGLVGAFCRVYDIPRAMNELLPGVYEPVDNDPDRFTYTGGSTSGGAVVYEGKWLYSHHATDPAGGKLCNAFDLVRLHRFGDLDENTEPDTPNNRLPSYAAMCEFALNDNETKLRLLDDRAAAVKEDFGTGVREQGAGSGEQGNSLQSVAASSARHDAPDARDAKAGSSSASRTEGEWRLELKTNAKGTVLGSLDNLRLIMDHTPEFSCISLDTFQQRCLVRGPLPWNGDERPRDWEDADDIGLAWLMEVRYGITDLRRIKMAVDSFMDRHRSDCLTEYLDALKWDGVPRVDELLIRYLRADDTAYVRAVTRKTLVAAVARAYEPGRKFDTVLTLTGTQGIGKSLIWGILGGPWYNDNIQEFTGKDASEQLRGVWIAEIAEVDRFSAKYEASAVKQFITRQDDVYREPYARRTAPHPRRCIFTATTNQPDFLTDTTGNRRWWVVRCRATPEQRGDDLNRLRRERNQVWAEAAQMWRDGENLTLEDGLYADAARAQEDALTADPWQGLIAEFVERPVPEDWDAREPDARRTWWADEFGQRQCANLAERKRVCAVEIWVELFERDRASLDGRASRRITNALRRLPGWTEVGSRPGVYGSQKTFVRRQTTVDSRQSAVNGGKGLGSRERGAGE